MVCRPQEALISASSVAGDDWLDENCHDIAPDRPEDIKIRKERSEVIIEGLSGISPFNGDYTMSVIKSEILTAEEVKNYLVKKVDSHQYSNTEIYAAINVEEFEVSREVYTVMADNGVGEFLWYKPDESRLPLIGSCHYNLMDRWLDEEKPLMSLDLFLEFSDWAKWYMGSYSDGVDGPSDINWDDFNAEGIKLAILLKMELGDGRKVVYSKACEDPSNSHAPGIESRIERLKNVVIGDI